MKRSVRAGGIPPQVIDPFILPDDFQVELESFDFANATGETEPNDPLSMDWTDVINTPTYNRDANDLANTALFDLGTEGSLI